MTLKGPPTERSLLATSGCVAIVAFLYWGLRIYDNYAANGSLDLALSLTHSWTQYHFVFPVVSALMRLPFVLGYSLIVVLALGVFLRGNIWVYALAVAVSSEVLWTAVWRVWVWDRGWSEVITTWSLAQAALFTSAPPVVALLAERVFGAAGNRGTSANQAAVEQPKGVAQDRGEKAEGREQGRGQPLC